MHVSLEIPEDLGRRIAADPGELPRAALEALALEAIRAGKLTVSQARRLLGIRSRYEMDGFLKTHGVFLDLTLELADELDGSRSEEHRAATFG
jgi:hypothetical protein